MRGEGWRSGGEDVEFLVNCTRLREKEKRRLPRVEWNGMEWNGELMIELARYSLSDVSIYFLMSLVVKR